MNLSDFKTSIVIAEYPGLGFLPIVLRNGKEVYRGEYKATRLEAFTRAENFLKGEV